jgi:predicted metal-dependent hydrolase
MKEADPTIRALWVWHQVEEVEHGAVAFDFYQAFYPHNEWYRRGMVCYAYCHIAWETFKAFAHMIKVEGFYKQPGRAFKAWKFFAGFAWDLAIAGLPVFSRKYHPRNHPICTNSQNALAVAWRQYYAEGNDPHLLDKKSVEEMMTPS